ncbi:hypothetical protein [Winogradskyella sp. SM1960]|uniref:hypothetical protein n=1 Tax=Winogradskyella sp. SM1960 TaxID=2865955 RepID=UPI001CD330B9|nr:hypothetical protein [Winogradskyella sp. SM1960]
MKLDEPITKPFFFVLFGLIVLGSLIFQLNAYFEKTEIKKHKIEVIGKVIDQYRNSKSTRHIRYEYTFEGRTYEDTKALGNNSKNYLNKYFKVNISEAKPDFSIILLDEEIIIPTN